MKKSIILFIFIFALSCQENKTNFVGLGEIKIGENFASISNSDAFRKVSDGEFFTDRFHISDEIGFVSDINVTTFEDKICEVKFSNTEETNMAELKKVLESLEHKRMDQQLTNLINIKDYSVEIYTTKDENISFIVENHKDKNLKNGQPFYEFSYINKDAFMRNHEMTLKIIGKK